MVRGLEQITKLKGICRKFSGTFEPFEWNKIVILSKLLTKAQVRTINTIRRKVLTITSDKGVLNVIAEPTEQVIYGNLLVRGDSVKEITDLPLWKLFQLIALSFQTNARIQFYPETDVCLEFCKGILCVLPNQIIAPRMEELIDQFLYRVRLNYLLERLHMAIIRDDDAERVQLKKELTILTDQSSN
jgi:hypothetical protein